MAFLVPLLAIIFLCSGCTTAYNYGGLVNVCATVVATGEPITGPVFIHVRGHGKQGKAFDSAIREDGSGTYPSDLGYTTLDENGYGCIQFWAQYKNDPSDPDTIILNELTAQVGSVTVGGKVVSYSADEVKNPDDPILILDTEFDQDYPEDNPGKVEFQLY